VQCKKKTKLSAEIDRIEKSFSTTNFDLEKVTEYETEFDAFQEEKTVFVADDQRDHACPICKRSLKRKEILSVCGVKKERKQKFGTTSNYAGREL
jgi:DNA repair exonuclease SbcCD ATPase subunit